MNDLMDGQTELNQLKALVAQHARNELLTEMTGLLNQAIREECTLREFGARMLERFLTPYLPSN